MQTPVEASKQRNDGKKGRTGLLKEDEGDESTVQDWIVEEMQ